MVALSQSTDKSALNTDDLSNNLLQEGVSTSVVDTPCYHCGLPVDDKHSFTLHIKEQQRLFCCPGCQAVAGAIHDGGLDNFYKYRSELSHRPEIIPQDFSLYDRDDIQQSFVDNHDDDQKTAHLLIDDITCAACVWLIEKRLGAIHGVKQVRINAATHQGLIRWNPQEIALSQLMSELAYIGYRSQPRSADNEDSLRKKKQRMALMRLAVAAFGMMQVGMVSIGLYAGAIQGMNQEWVDLFRWVSLVVATPVVLFSAQPFWSAAWRSLKRRYLTMEVPVALAIVLAYIASVWATVTGSGEVYFDSVSMFTFFLLIGRYLEMRTRYRNHQQTANYTRLLPMAVQRVQADDYSQTELLPINQLKVGDYVRINTGDTIPCDGNVVEGESEVVEALLTGEAEPIRKSVGDSVVAGTVNTDGSVVIKALAVDQQTRLSTIEKLVSFAQQDKPQVQIIADKVASYFVAAVLLVSTAVFVFWYQYHPEEALWVTLSVLVVTCPCALSLATPTVLTATIAKLRANGLLVLKGHVIEGLTSIKQVVFDKTGTLTYGQPKVENVYCCSENCSEVGNEAYSEGSDGKHLETCVATEEQQVSILAICACLEEGSSHPIATAFTEYRRSYQAIDRRIVIGSGVKAVIDDDEYAIGKPSFVLSKSIEQSSVIVPPTDGQYLLLSRNGQAMAWVQLSDRLRESAQGAVTQLNDSGITVEILSGDNEYVVSNMANDLGILHYKSGVSPEEKLASIRDQQQQHPVMMVGDGINDVPVLAGADISVAMDSASDFARTNADTVLLSNDLTVLPQAIVIAHRCRKIIRQNVAWALGYNLVALPLAASGLIPPYLAALGMSLSSLIVVINALRV